MGERDCSTCIHRDTETNECKKGTEAELYCMGGDFELWASELELNKFLNESEESVVEQQQMDVIKVAREKGILSQDAEDEKVFSMPEQPFAAQLSGDVIQDMRFISGFDAEGMESQIGREFSEDERAQFEEIKLNAKKYLDMLDRGDVTEDQLREHFTAVQAFSETLNNRPKEEGEGYNGVKKTEEVKAYSCKGCKNFSNVGCFLGRYYDCVDNGRYLFDPVVPEESLPLERQEEMKADEKDIGYIDSLLDDQERKKQ